MDEVAWGIRIKYYQNKWHNEGGDRVSLQHVFRTVYVFVDEIVL